MRNTTESKIAKVAARSTIPTRRSRNTYENSAMENKLAMTTNARSGRGAPRKERRNGGSFEGARAVSFTRRPTPNEIAAGIAGGGKRKREGFPPRIEAAIPAGG